jgi:hypothetical protein
MHHAWGIQRQHLVGCTTCLAPCTHICPTFNRSCCFPPYALLMNRLSAATTVSVKGCEPTPRAGAPRCGQGGGGCAQNRPCVAPSFLRPCSHWCCHQLREVLITSLAPSFAHDLPLACRLGAHHGDLVHTEHITVVPRRVSCKMLELVQGSVAQAGSEGLRKGNVCAVKVALSYPQLGTLAMKVNVANPVCCRTGKGAGSR